MSNFTEIKIRVADDSIELPTYETKSSAGMDIRAYLPDGNITLEFGKGDYHFYGSYGTGFKAPTLYEFLSEELMMNWNIMQMVRINNSNLRPAKSRGYSFGVLRQLANDSSIGILYFNNDIEDNIGWNNDNYRFENLGEVKTRGYEVTLEKKINDSLNLNSSLKAQLKFY